MHACLNTDEIVRLIACELVASEAKATAVALACCHIGFEDPVLDALWETQEELLPLLGSLPKDVWKEGGCTSFKRFPTTPEWARFRKYARRMRKLEPSRPLDRMASEVFPVLQLYAIKEPLFPNLKTLKLSVLTRELIPCIPLFLSPRTTTIYIAFASLPNIPKVIIVSMISTFPTLCPNLQSIELQFLPRDPMITAALSGMLLTGNLDALRILKVDSPLAEEAHEAIHALTDLHELSVVIEKDPFLLPLVLPNLTRLTIEYDHGSAWLQMFRGATLGRLESVTFHPRSEEIGPFLEAFEKVALATSAHSTLSQFCLKTPYPWDPNYSSLLPFTQLTHLIIEFSCDEGCSSTMDDDIITNLARTMPKLDTLQLGEPPCQEIRTGVTTKGFTALAHYCSDLSALRIHFQVASLCAPPVNYRMVFDAGSTAPRRGCALRSLDVGEVPVPEDSVLMVALNLSLIFPNINSIEYDGENWERVADAVYLSNAIIRCTRTTPEGSG